jgi:uncharacterized protein (TIGR02217 family)
VSIVPYPTRTVITTADLSQDADVFPILPGEDFLLAKSPQFSTGMQMAASGREIRVGYWSSPKYNFSVRHNALRRYANMDEAQRLLAFFNSREGRFGVFYYWDDEDYQVNGDQFAVGDGQSTTFQLGRILAKGTPQATFEPIRAVWTEPTIEIAGTPASGFTIGTTGTVTFASPPAYGAALTWTGQFLYLCRFDQDTLDMAQLLSLLWSQKGLKFVTVPA